MKKRLLQSLTIGLSMLFVANISHAAILDIRDGQLYGASGVDVDGVLYDVLFIDGTAIDLYNGADENTDFTFYTGASFGDPNGTNLAVKAGNALLDQVFINEFDDSSELTNGIRSTGGGYVYIPVWVNAQGGMGVIWALNSSVYEDVVGAGSALNTYDSSPLEHAPDDDHVVWAVWQESSAVPIPGACLLLSSGLIALIGFGRKKRE